MEVLPNERMSRVRSVSRRLQAAAETLRANFFFLPAVAVVAAFVAARIAVGVEAGTWVGESTVDNARAVLSTVAAATITFASISFSVSLLIMQLGSQQFSPRVIHGLTRDPFHRRVIAVVLATFTFCLVTLQRVRGPLSDGGNEVVPDFSVAVGLLLGLLAVLAIVAAIHHTSQQMDVSVILGRIVDEAVRTSSASHAGPSALSMREAPTLPDHPAPTVIRFAADGWVRQVDRVALLALGEPGGVVELDTDTGRYVIAGTALCRVSPPVGRDRLDGAARAARAAVRLGPTRTMGEDSGYGVRQLVDVALRALSPGINDPTTAQDAIFHLGTVLAARFTAPAIPTAHRDDEGRHLLAPHSMTDVDLAELAVSELRAAAADQPMVCIYLLEMIAGVIDAAGASGDAHRARPLLAQAHLVLEHVDAADIVEPDRHRVRHAHAKLFGA